MKSIQAVMRQFGLPAGLALGLSAVGLPAFAAGEFTPPQGRPGGLCGRQRRSGRAVREALGVQRVLRVERALAHAVHGGDTTEEHVRRRTEREPGVLMVVVVPPEERLEPAAREPLEIAGADQMQRCALRRVRFRQ